ncbi:MAG: NAD(P)-binding protein [Bacillota bacterium]
MKVAIIGAGPSGLACAHELQRHGIYPVIYEQRHRPGELFDHCAAVLELFTRPYQPLAYLKKRFYLDIRPISQINSIVMKSPGKKVTVKGKLGYFFMRGGSPASVESQLYGKVKGNFIFNTKADYSKLAPHHDFVVVANGGYNVSRTVGTWTLVLPTKLIGSSVVGRFETNKMYMWVDNRYSRKAYAYLAPMDKERAFLGLVVPESTVEEARKRWQLFWEMERLPYDRVNEIIVEHNAGFVYPHQVGNLLFVGIAGGFLEPFLGFGLISAVKSGVLAGRAIATGQKYEDLIVQLKEDMQHSLILRDLFNRAENYHYDRLMSLLGIPGIKQFIYNTNFDVVRIGSAAIAGFKKIMGRFKNV